MTVWDHDLWLRFRNGPPVESLDWRLLIDEIQELRDEADERNEEVRELEGKTEKFEAVIENFVE